MAMASVGMATLSWLSAPVEEDGVGISAPSSATWKDGLWGRTAQRAQCWGCFSLRN